MKSKVSIPKVNPAHIPDNTKDLILRGRYSVSKLRDIGTINPIKSPIRHLKSEKIYQIFEKAIARLNKTKKNRIIFINNFLSNFPASFPENKDPMPAKRNNKLDDIAT